MFTKYEITYPSSDKKSQIVADIFEPSAGGARAIVQLSHGMVDHPGRYEALAEYLTERGVILAANHHLGHGKSVSRDEDFGYFADGDGITCLLRDMHQLNRTLRERYAGLPIILMGHSMGSFLSRLYVERYPHTIVGHIIHGTGGPHKLMLPIGRALISLISLFRGKRYRSGFIAGLAFSGYNSRFDRSEGKNAWLTRDTSKVAGRDDDKFTSFIFTLEGYNELFRMISAANSGKWFNSYPKNMPTVIMSGTMDPVGQYGKGVSYVFKHMLMAGCSSLTLKTYEGARHELFNETDECRDEVFADILAFITQCTAK